MKLLKFFFIGFILLAVGDISPKNIVKSIRHAFDTSEISVLTQEMVKADFTKEEISKIMGENAVKFLMIHLPTH